MKETATVIAIEEHCVWVETQRQGSCNTCVVKQGCGQGMMSRLMPGREHYIRALVDDDEQHRQLAVGDRVEIVVPDELVLKASVIVYLVPLLMLLAGMFVGDGLVPGDPGSIVGGVMGLLLGAVLVRWHARSVRSDSRVQPRVVAVAAGLEVLSLPS
jgi:sigma-E factor negative regulatory protein RseC